MRLGFVTGVVVCGILLAGGISDLHAADYEVTFTNMTHAQVITPPVLFSHTKLYSVFKVGEQAKGVLAQLAESGNGEPLMALLMSLSQVSDVQGATQPILPGESLTMTVRTTDRMDHISALGMLAQTNDGFFGISGVMVPAEGTKVVYANVWDAGTEENNELSTHVPGPPFGGSMRDIVGAEEFVHIHPGIHGVGDLDASVYDWRNPAVMVTIKLIQ